MRRSPSRQDVHELVEELSILLAAVEAPELGKHVADCIARLEILAGCDHCTDDAQHAVQLGRALVAICDRQLGNALQAAVAVA